MFSLKRLLIVAVVLALALGTVGIMTANAQDTTQPQETGTAWLGVTVMDTDSGVTIHQVMPDSPADKAGLQSGDIIKSVDGTAVDSAAALTETIQSYTPGDEITVTVSRDDEVKDITVTLAERPAENAAPSLNFGRGPHAGLLSVLGLDVAVQDNGLLIDAIADDSPLVDSGLQVGDVITKINGESVLDQRGGMMFGFRSGESVVFTVLRDGEEIDITADVNLSEWPGNLQVVPGEQGYGFNFAQARPTQLGVQFRTLTPEYAQSEDLPVEQGALVEQVYEDTPAATAGLQAGDIITAVSGDPLDEERTLTDRLYAYEEGDAVTLTVLRDGEEMQIDVVLGPRASQPMMVPDWFGGSNMGPRQDDGGMFRFHRGNPDVPAPVEPTPEAPAA